MRQINHSEALQTEGNGSRGRLQKYVVGAMARAGPDDAGMSAVPAPRQSRCRRSCWCELVSDPSPGPRRCRVSKESPQATVAHLSMASCSRAPGWDLELSSQTSRRMLLGLAGVQGWVRVFSPGATGGPDVVRPVVDLRVLDLRGLEEPFRNPKLTHQVLKAAGGWT